MASVTDGAGCYDRLTKSSVNSLHTLETGLEGRTGMALSSSGHAATFDKLTT